MPFLTHSRITLTGDLGTTSPAPEHFSFGFSTDLGDFSTPAAQAAVKAAGENFFAGGGGKIGGWATLRNIKIASIGVDGKYTANAVNVACTGPGNGSSPSHPFQVSLAVGLRTALRGGSNRGRMYLPAPTIGIDTASGLFSPLIVPGIEAAVVTLLHGICNAPAVPVAPVIASRKGTSTRVDRVQVGVVLDTIRTRRRSLPESLDAGTVYS